MIHILEKYNKNGIYVRNKYTFKRKGMLYYLTIIRLKILRKEIEIVEE